MGVFDNNWAHSGVKCVVVGNKPKVQIWGSDLISGSDVQTSQTVKGSTSNTFGSWVEYAIFSRGIITGTASSSAFNIQGGAGLPGSTIAKYSRLSFSNTNQPTTSPCSAVPGIGCYYNSAPTMPSIEDAFSSTGNVSGSVDLGSIAGGVYSYSGTAGLTINGGTVTGKSVVINAPNSDITINTNIEYTTATLSSIKEIPQVVIIAKSISIADSVTRVDSWLIAKKSTSYINTCASIPVTGNPPLSSATCASPLRVNGPVQATKLYLRRTAGTAGTGEPAEVFDLRADAYLWAISRSMNTGTIKTVQTKSLPARY
jgi:hypothetical protein